eukprot:gene19555-21487_t
MERWHKYCEELYNYKIQKDEKVLDEIHQTDDIREEEEVLMSAIKELKRNKSPGADNTYAELIQAGGEATTKILHKICNETSQWTESKRLLPVEIAEELLSAEERGIAMFDINLAIIPM